MSTQKTSSPELLPKSMLSYAKDLPNICSLTGLACTLLAIYFIILGNYHAAMIGMVWAVAFDWADGLIARRMKGRTDEDRTFGGHLDSLIDIVSFGVAPGVLLMSYGKYEPIFVIGAFIILAVSAIRLSYFNTFGLVGRKKHTGLPLDNNSLLLVFIYLFEGLFSEGAFSIILYLSFLVLTALNISQINTPKLSRNPINVVILAVYTLMITAVYSWKLVS